MRVPGVHYKRDYCGYTLPHFSNSMRQMCTVRGAFLVFAETESETEAETSSVIESDIEIGDEDRDRD